MKSSFFFVGVRSLQCNHCLLQNDSPYKSAFCFHPSSVDFRQFWMQSNHLNFRLPASLLPSGFPRNTVFTVMSSDILNRWPAYSSLHIVIVVTIFGFKHNLQLPLNFARYSKKIQNFVRSTRSPRQQWPPHRTKNDDLSIVFTVQGIGGSGIASRSVSSGL